ncbi:MAG: sugar ABC transporter permease [Defluviitaleaceae bacterium]|nr:sugar ABC transporter permease [Defluviitaleaceae bacterium]
MSNVKNKANAKGRKAAPGTIRVKQKISLTPYLLLLPWFIGITVFRIYPLILSFWYSLLDIHFLTRQQTFIGFENYRHAFQNSFIFWPSVAATFRYVLIGTPLVLIVAFFVAFVLNFKLKAINLFRTAYYVPSILGGNVAVSVLWNQVFAPAGPVNTVLGVFGVDPIPWRTTETFAPFMLILLSAWQFGSVMIIFLAGLQNVSPSLYEAASIEGASRTRQLFKITIPIVTPMILFNTVNVLVRHFQEFNSAWLITGGGPNGATRFLNIYIFQAFGGANNFGYASALTWILLSMIGILSIILFQSQKHWVHYND